MPYFRTGETTIYYEISGHGFPLLLLPGGAMNATLDFWERAPFNPIAALNPDFRTIAIDQRNAGRSSGPLAQERPWDTYADDALALMDHLGIQEFHILGCCIGCSHALKLIDTAPHRVVACVLEQPVGKVDDNAAIFESVWKPWASGSAASGRFAMSELEAFCEAMFSGDFALSVTRDDLASYATPILVLPGIDKPHPTEVGREIAKLVRAGEVLEPWKEPSSLVPATVRAIREFLHDRTPRLQPESTGLRV